MVRPPRVSLPSYPHHVIQRGNNRRQFFWLQTIMRFFWSACGRPCQESSRRRTMHAAGSLRSPARRRKPCPAFAALSRGTFHDPPSDAFGQDGTGG